MARVIAVTPEEMEKTATTIEGLAGDYKTQYDTLYKETDAMKSTWDGKDNQAYTQQIDGFKDDLKNMYDLMNQYVEFLRKSAKAYRDTQDAIVTDAKTLRN